MSVRGNETQRKRIVVTAHRGASALEPENTLRAFRRACDLGADCVETDVRLTRDGRVVCLHDATLDCTTTGSGKLEEWTFARLQSLDAGQGERVPTLEEALAVVRNRAILEIELKSPGSALPTLRILDDLGVRSDEVILISFLDSLLAEAAQARPDLPRGLLLFRPASDMIARARAIGAVGLWLRHEELDAEIVRSVRDAHLRIHAWTVDEPLEMRRLVHLGVEGITTNRPDALVKLLGEVGRSRR